MYEKKPHSMSDITYFLIRADNVLRAKEFYRSLL